jgi:hypothetical protein
MTQFVHHAGTIRLIGYDEPIPYTEAMILSAVISDEYIAASMAEDIVKMRDATARQWSLSRAMHYAREYRRAAGHDDPRTADRDTHIAAMRGDD